MAGKQQYALDGEITRGKCNVADQLGGTKCVSIASGNKGAVGKAKV